MGRDFQINGPCLVGVRSRSDSSIGSPSELGLSDAPIRVVPNFSYLEIHVDAWGNAPPEVQMMLASVDITISLVHFDTAVLRECVRLSLAGSPAEGQMPIAGARMGNNVALFAPGNNFIAIALTSPVGGLPWRFPYCFMTGPPINWPLGAERSVVVTQWKANPADIDIYNGGTASYGKILWDHTL